MRDHTEKRSKNTKKNTNRKTGGKKNKGNQKQWEITPKKATKQHTLRFIAQMTEHKVQWVIHRCISTVRYCDRPWLEGAARWLVGWTEMLKQPEEVGKQPGREPLESLCSQAGTSVPRPELIFSPCIASFVDGEAIQVSPSPALLEKHCQRYLLETEVCAHTNKTRTQKTKKSHKEKTRDKKKQKHNERWHRRKTQKHTHQITEIPRRGKKPKKSCDKKHWYLFGCSAFQSEIYLTCFTRSKSRSISRSKVRGFPSEKQRHI